MVPSLLGFPTEHTPPSAAKLEPSVRTKPHDATLIEIYLRPSGSHRGLQIVYKGKPRRGDLRAARRGLDVVYSRSENGSFLERFPGHAC